MARHAGYRRSAPGDLSDHALRPDERELLPGSHPLRQDGGGQGPAAARAEPGQRRQDEGGPVTAIIGYDTRFYELLPKLFPHRPEMKNPYEANARLAETVAFRNGTLQGAYFMIAARAVGLDVGGMSGFDNAKVDAEFFPDGRVKSNFLCNIGHGDPSKILPKLPRLEFDEACSLL
jgi:3-hydroxypropanoate dehydrogenase